jgi:hypothetical protein
VLTEARVLLTEDLNDYNTDLLFKDPRVGPVTRTPSRNYRFWVTTTRWGAVYHDGTRALKRSL